MSCFQCLLKRVQSGVTLEFLSWERERRRVARAQSEHREGWEDSRLSTPDLSSSFLLAGCLVKQKPTAENSRTMFDTSKKVP